MTTSPAKIEDFCQLPYKGERAERCQWQKKRGERVAAVEKIEEKRKPEDFFGHRNRKARGAAAPVQQYGGVMHGGKAGRALSERPYMRAGGATGEWAVFGTGDPSPTGGREIVWIRRGAAGEWVDGKEFVRREAGDRGETGDHAVF